jgi:hypothetical protein
MVPVVECGDSYLNYLKLQFEINKTVSRIIKVTLTRVTQICLLIGTDLLVYLSELAGKVY